MPIFRVVLGIVVSYILSVATSLAWFYGTHHDPSAPASGGFIALTAVYGVIVSFLLGWLAARIAANPWGGYGMALLIVLASIWEYVEGRNLSGSKWSFVVALLFMVPAAALGSRLTTGRRPILAPQA